MRAKLVFWFAPVASSPQLIFFCAVLIYARTWILQWVGASSTSFSFLNRDQRKAIRLISDPSQTFTLQCPANCTALATLFISDRYYFRLCSSRHPSQVRLPVTFSSSSSINATGHPYQVSVARWRTSLLQFFFPDFQTVEHYTFLSLPTYNNTLYFYLFTLLIVESNVYSFFRNEGAANRGFQARKLTGGRRTRTHNPRARTSRSNPLGYHRPRSGSINWTLHEYYLHFST